MLAEWSREDRRIAAFWTFAPALVVVVLGVLASGWLLSIGAPPQAIAASVTATATAPGAVFAGCIRALPMIMGGIGIMRSPPGMQIVSGDGRDDQS